MIALCAVLAIGSFLVGIAFEHWNHEPELNWIDRQFDT